MWPEVTSRCACSARLEREPHAQNADGGRGLLSPLGIFAAYAHSLSGPWPDRSVAVFFWIFWSIAVHSLAGDYFPPRAVASVYGIAGTGSTVGSAISTWAVGKTLDVTHSYTLVFIGLSLLMPVAMVVGFSLMGRVEMVRDSTDTPRHTSYRPGAAQGPRLFPAPRPLPPPRPPPATAASKLFSY